MKQVVTLVFCSVFLLTGVHAQVSFSVQHDTVSATPNIGVGATLEDEITATTGTVNIVWKVIASDFPADWITMSAICDNKGCYPVTGVWSSSSGTGTAETSNPYGATGSFHMLIGFSDTNSVGCHYMTVKMHNQAMPMDTAYETFLVCNYGIALGIVGSKLYSGIDFYPNPAYDHLTVLYDAGYEVSNLLVCDFTGRVLATQTAPVSGNTILDLKHIPQGNYCLRLINAHGATVAVKKFTRM